MRTLLPHSRTGLLLLLVACSDRHPTRPDRAAAQHPAAPAGQLSGVATPQAAATPPASMSIAGRTLGCFGAGCTPSDFAFITVNGAQLTYFSGLGFVTNFGGNAVNGVLAVNGAPSAGNHFGLIRASLTGTTQPTAVSVPFTLQLTLQSPAAAPVTVSGTVRGIVTGSPIAGGVVLAFDEKKTAGGKTVKVDFVDPSTGAAGRMDVSVFSVPIPSSESVSIPGFFEIR